MRKRKLNTLLLAIPLLLLAARAAADEALPLAGALTIDAPFVAAAPAGRCTKVRFRIENETSQDLHLLGVRTDVSDVSRLVARVDPTASVTLESIGVGAGETLDLASSHLWYELCGLRRPLLSGDRIAITLDFVDGSVSVPFHVH